jgi:hypothetical protein
VQPDLANPSFLLLERIAASLDPAVSSEMRAFASGEGGREQNTRLAQTLVVASLCNPRLPGGAIDGWAVLRAIDILTPRHGLSREDLKRLESEEPVRLAGMAESVRGLPDDTTAGDIYRLREVLAKWAVEHPSRRDEYAFTIMGIHGPFHTATLSPSSLDLLRSIVERRSSDLLGVVDCGESTWTAREVRELRGLVGQALAECEFDPVTGVPLGDAPRLDSLLSALPWW